MPAPTKASYLDQLIDDIASFTHDPYGHALYAYPWGEEGTALAETQGPRTWQRETLEIIGKHLQNPETRHQPCRIAVSSGHGIGKSALISMIAKWGVDTCEDCRVVVTANTESQILTKTWPEVLKWHRLAITKDWFVPTATRIVSAAPAHKDSWRVDAVTWSLNNTEAFAGLHNLRKRIIVIYDEGSGIDDKVWEVTQGALTDEDTEIIWIAFGNPTLNTGRFRECFGRERHLWHHRQIDSRDVEGTNKKYLQELVDTYGLDSDIVKVRVRGMFPSASSMQFIPTDLVESARKRDPAIVRSEPVIFGLDCARYGDDKSVMAVRHGRDARSIAWLEWSGNDMQRDLMRVAGDIAVYAKQFRPGAIFIDKGAMGAGVIDRLNQLNVDNVIPVGFGDKGKSVLWNENISVQTANKRAEMWCSMRAWLELGAVPDDEELQMDMIGLEYGYAADQTSILLEKKQHMKERGLASPDKADALALTFAHPVAPISNNDYGDIIGVERITSRYDELYGE